MTPRERLAQIPLWAKVLGLAFGLVVGGATVGQRWLGVPAQVEAAKAANARQDDEIREIRRDVTLILDGQRRMLCLLTLADSVSPLQAQRMCP